MSFRELLLILKQLCNLREKAHLQKNYTPEGSIDDIFPGTYYLAKVDDMFRRFYEIKQ
jgi:hydroxymethylglutaryl-CoA synthase